MEMNPGKVFIGGISWETNEERLRNYFQTFGEVVEALIMKDRNTGRARGFGFVVFADTSVAEIVVRERHTIDGRTVEAKKAVPRDDHQNINRNNGSVQGSPGPARTKKIFVGGLASTVTESDFKRYFEQFGTITDVVVMYDHNTQRPRGFGFITYDSEEAVDKVLFKTFHELNGKMVEVKRAVPKELSPGPTRSPLTGYNHGLNRASSFLDSITQGYNSISLGGYGMRMDGRFSPMSVTRNGYLPYSPSNYSTGLSLDLGLSSNYGMTGEPGLGYGRIMNSYYRGNQSRYGNLIGYNMGDGGNGSLLDSINPNMWGNESLNFGTNSMISETFVGSRSGNTGIVGGLGSIGGTWGSSPISAQGGGNGSLSSGDFGNYSSRQNSFGGRGGYNRNTEDNVITSAYSAANEAQDDGFGNLYGANTSYGDLAWRSLSPELEGSASFGYGLSTAAADVTPKNSVGYVGGGYSVTTRSNRGIAA
ncbi:heterogeneous nuclear ribonucleoprotein 1-like [Olea europaea var. sylvestris]|uniref:heterogeneous nuclear ribonucleoprotein 1-like n=1 Tax=Olea europaea var. sylvestris TaxID=158386 RepID=UPI000C1D07EC|nr:heterogeneous nuclear ribonucleoprotein 1-like [Olea europaea var. sylvestris]XP_022869473.1 heterogeneous nuclear ribonucleoprotein 1-like [Olea europaea var. sylvestris]XP_022869474.1 heterogeneous nuclear ribonucleoprotein 1-like [Olea europaea var. sylvestris]XP_022869475.1 heterogeneous nuclear ribonucleoprotein 1-like [Olea europaea var. sylvestris]XP_022869476.1 heterogeneous nuclear ribonucleoprotein 1-like [Olea europaea var. sylvestris]XP_022869477.1 heterogeneous nuclear ribonucl